MLLEEYERHEKILADLEDVTLVRVYSEDFAPSRKELKCKNLKMPKMKKGARL